MTIMIFLYLRMGLRIRKTTQFGKNTAVHGESKQVQSKRAILKMLGKNIKYKSTWEIKPKIEPFFLQLLSF